MTTATSHPAFLMSQEGLRNEVSAVLNDIFGSRIKQARTVDKMYADLLEQTRLLVSRGGKRLRPILTVLSYEGYGGTDRKAILPVAVSQELFHAFILIHDDIIDRDDVRWRGLNLSGHYSKEFGRVLRNNSDAKHFADMWALLAGDLCLNISLDTLSNSPFPSDKVLSAHRYVYNTLFGMIGGELIDTALPLGLPWLKATEQRLLKVCKYKTSIYSFCTPLQLGALFAGANDNTLQKLEEFGVALGIAYQIRDDLLGMFGNEDELGKPCITDLREGKQTILILYLEQLASRRQLQRAKLYIGNPKVTDENLEEMRRILVTCGAKDKTEKLAYKYIKTARSLLPRLALSTQATDSLQDLVEFAVDRRF